MINYCHFLNFALPTMVQGTKLSFCFMLDWVTCSLCWPFYMHGNGIVTLSCVISVVLFLFELLEIL